MEQKSVKPITYKLVGSKYVFQKDGTYIGLTKDQLPEMKAAIERAIEESQHGNQQKN